MASPIPRLPPVTNAERPVGGATGGATGGSAATSIPSFPACIVGRRTEDRANRPAAGSDPIGPRPVGPGAPTSASGNPGGEHQGRGRPEDDQHGAGDEPGLGHVLLLGLIADLLTQL